MVIVSGVLIYRLAANRFSGIDFSLFAIIRRTVSLILPLVLLGVGVGIPRYVALTEDESTGTNYLVSGLLLSFIGFFIFAIPCYIFREEMSFLIFSSSGYSEVFAPMLLMIGAMLFHSATYSYLRGKMMMMRANLLQLCNLGIAPLIGFFIYEELVPVLYFSALSWFVFSFFFFLITAKDMSIRSSIILSQVKELLTYGVQRVPGDLLLAGFFAFPAFIVSHISGVEEAGNVAFAVTLLSLAGAFFGPVSLLLLPKAAAFIKAKNLQGIREISRKVMNNTLVLTFIGVVIFIFLSETFLDLYLKNYNPAMVNTVRIIMLGAVGYCVYIVLRSILDAVSVKGLNTLNILISFGVFATISTVVLLAGLSLEIIYYGFVISVSLLGYLTSRKILSFLKQEA